MSPKLTGAKFIAETFKGYGLTHIFFVEAILRLSLIEMEALGIRRVLTHGEKAAAYMADGYSKTSRKPGICMAQSVGAANLAAGLQDAFLGLSPVIALTGRKHSLAQYRHAYQEILHAPMFNPVTKYNVTVETIDQLPYLLRQAFREVTSGAPGPAHLDLMGHQGQTIEASEADIGVVVEKPFVQDIPEGEKLIELALRKGKIMTVFQSRRFEGDFLTIRKIIDNQLLGRLVEYEAHFDRFRNFIRDSWKEKPENKTGTLYNLGSHLVDQAIVLFGMPDAVYADIRKQRTGSQVDDLFDLNLFYPSVKVTLKSSYLVREPGPRYLLHGTEGSYVKYGIDPQEEALTRGRYPNEADWGKESEDKWGILNTTLNGLHFRGPVETLPGCYHEFYNSLYETLVNGRELAVKPQESLNGIRVIKAAYESCERRCATLTK